MYRFPGLPDTTFWCRFGRRGAPRRTPTVFWCKGRLPCRGATVPGGGCGKRECQAVGCDQNGIRPHAARVCAAVQSAYRHSGPPFWGPPLCEPAARITTQVTKIAEGQEDRTRSREHATGRSQGDHHMTGVCVVQVPRDALEPNAASEAAPEAVRQAVGGGCQSGWGRVFSVTNAIEAGTWRQGDSGWA